MVRALYIAQVIFEAKKKRGPMLTISELTQAINNRGQAKPVTISVIKTTPLVGNKTLTATAQAKGSKLYSLTVTFYNVDYSLEKDPDHPLRVHAQAGHTAYMEVLSERVHPVQVRCSCPDFIYSYSHWNRQNKALSGPAHPQYQRKTTTMPERNPSRTPGVCKHLIGLFQRLAKDRILGP